MTNSKTTEESVTEQVVASERRLIGWVMGIIGVLLTSGIMTVASLLWTQNEKLVSLNATVADLGASLESVTAQMAQAAASCYTSQDASADRATLVRLIEPNTIRLNKHDEDIRQIMVELARLQKAY